MAGFLKLAPVPDDFAGRVVNIHPALIPAFCGPGMYGHRVHQAVLDAGVKVTGCTVHFVDNEYDHGPIIWQQPVPVFDDDTADTLAKRVFEVEKEAYPHVLQAAGGRADQARRPPRDDPEKSARRTLAHRGVPHRLIERHRRRPTGVRFELHFAPAGIPRSALQMRHEHSTNTAATPCGIDQQPVHHGHACRLPFAHGKRHGTDQTAERTICIACHPSAFRTPPRLINHFAVKVVLGPRPNSRHLVRHRPIAQRQPTPTHHPASRTYASALPAQFSATGGATNCLRR